MWANRLQMQDIVIGAAVFATIIDLIYAWNLNVWNVRILYVTLSIIIACPLIFLFSLYKGLHWHRPLFHFWYGFSVTALLSGDRLTESSNFSFLIVLSSIFLSVAFLLHLLNELVVLSYTGSSFPDFFMWLGFTFGALFFDNPFPLLVCNFVVLLYWYILGQNSKACFTLYVISVSFSLLYVIPTLYAPKPKNPEEFTPPSYYYCFVFLPVAFFYSFYFVFKTFIRGSDQNLSTRCWLLVRSPGYIRRFALVVFAMFESTYLILCLIAHQRKSTYWNLLWVIPLIVFWILVRFGLFSFLSQLSTKFGECNQSNQLPMTQNAGLMDIWAATGIRTIALAHYPLNVLTPFTTILCFLSGFDINDWWKDTFFLTCLPIEVYLWIFTRELTYALGGSCVALKLMACSDLVTSSEQNARNSALSDALEIFFAEFGIHFYSTERATDARLPGTEINATENCPSQRMSTINELAKFFSLHVPGTDHRYDTYFLYRTGAANFNGDWLMHDGSTIGLSDIIQLWEDSFRNTTDIATRHRLILVLDQLNGMKWYQQLLVLPTQSLVALQTVDMESEVHSRRGFVRRLFCRDLLLSDYNLMMNRVGDFTLKWVNRNFDHKYRAESGKMLSDRPNDPRCVEVIPTVLARYVVTSNWKTIDTRSVSDNLEFLRAVPLVRGWWALYAIAKKREENISKAIRDYENPGYFKRACFSAWKCYRKLDAYFKPRYLETDRAFLLIDGKL